MLWCWVGCSGGFPGVPQPHAPAACCAMRCIALRHAAVAILLFGACGGTRCAVVQYAAAHDQLSGHFEQCQLWPRVPQTTGGGEVLDVNPPPSLEIGWKVPVHWRQSRHKQHA